MRIASPSAASGRSTTAPTLRERRRHCLERRRQVARGVRALRARDFLGRAARDEPAAGVAALGAEIDDPVRGLHDLHVVLDHEERVAALDQPVERAEELGDVVEVEARRRLVEEEERRLVVVRRRGDMRGELQALRLAARERRQRLAEAHVLEADRGERLDRGEDLVARGEELDRLGDGHLEDVVDRLAADGDFEHFSSESCARALGTGHVDVREELHLDLLVALAAARLAAPALDVERERRGRVARGGAIDPRPRIASAPGRTPSCR